MTLDELRQHLTVNVPTAAKVLGISRTHAYDAIREGRIPAIRLGRRVVVPARALEEMLNQAGAPGTA